MSAAPKFWFSQNILAWLMLPLSLGYCAVSTIRRWLYQHHYLRVRASSVPLIVVGNIAIGGTGKTPLIIALCGILKQKGFKVGVVSRGYGASISGLHDVSETDKASHAGDEPLLIRQRTGCPVIICANRPAAVEAIVEKYGCNLVLSDDGLQHYAMQRDLEIAVVDATRMHGNGFCLPAGPLREPVSRLQSVDMVVYNIDSSELGQHRPEFGLYPAPAIKLFDGSNMLLEEFTGQRVHAVAGIGNPQRFFSLLRRTGVSVIEHAFDDHHHYQSADLDFGDELPVLMTEKDAVKCREFAKANWWSINVEASVNEQFTEQLFALLQRLNITP